jgi:hypothetical protein
MKPRTVLLLKWIAIAVVALGVLYAVLLGVSTRSLRRAYAELEADGRPMSANEIIPPPLGIAENAAPLYEAAALQLRARAAGGTTLFEELSSLAKNILDKEPEPHQVARFAELLESNEVGAALKLVDEGASRAGYRSELDYSKGAEILLRHLPELRGLTWIQCARARMEAAEGDPEKAWRTILLTLNLADALRTEPILISQLVRIAQLRIVTSAIRGMCSVRMPDPGVAGELQQKVRGFEDQQPLVLAFDGERLLMGEWGFRLPRKELPTLLGMNDENPFLPLEGSLGLKPLRQADHAAYLRLMGDQAKMALLPYSAEDEPHLERRFSRIPVYYVLTRVMTPALARAKTRHMEMVALAKVTRAGLAAMKYRTEHGAYPADLSVLEMADAQDPFGGGPLRYEPRENGFILYSIGPNLKDENGQPRPKRKSEPDDIAWDYVEPDEAD